MISAARHRVLAIVGAGVLFVGALFIFRERALLFAGDYLVICDDLRLRATLISLVLPVVTTANEGR